MATPAPAEERMIWTGSPSQWLNFRSFLVSGMVMLVLIAAAVTVSSAGPAAVGGYQTPALVALAVLLLAVVLQAVRRYVEVRSRVYTISSQRVRLTRGILSKRSDGLELYRVDDTLLLEPMLLRLVSRGNIRLMTSDRTNPSLLIEAVPHAKQLLDEIRKSAEECRDRKSTRVVDFESTSHS